MSKALLFWNPEKGRTESKGTFVRLPTPKKQTKHFSITETNLKEEKNILSQEDEALQNVIKKLLKLIEEFIKNLKNNINNFYIKNSFLF